MSKLYVFGIGGTGSRVLSSLTMLLASGVKLGNGIDTIVPIIIDPDASNANLTNTRNIMRQYISIREKLDDDGTRDRKNDFFNVKINQLLGPNFNFPVTETNDNLFKDFINISQLEREDEAIVRMLFSDSNLDADMKVGFKGNPNMGSVALQQILDTDEFSTFVKDFEQNDRIFIVSSIFGGTGASGFPMLLNALNNSEDKYGNTNYLKKSIKGAVSVLPYFKVENNNKGEQAIDSSSFISKTKSALAYYEKNIKDISDVYFLADIKPNTYAYSEGGTTQENNAHYIEFLAATSIVDFTYRNNDKKSKEESDTTKYYEFGFAEGENKESEVLNYNDFPGDTKERILDPLTRWMIVHALLNTDTGWGELEHSATLKDFSKTKDTGFIRELKDFDDKLFQWLEEMKNNSRSLYLFDMDKFSDDPLQLIPGRKKKYNSWWKFPKRGYEHIIHFLNKNSRASEDNCTSFMQVLIKTASDVAEDLPK